MSSTRVFQDPSINSRTNNAFDSNEPNSSRQQFDLNTPMSSNRQPTSFNIRSVTTVSQTNTSKSKTLPVITVKQNEMTSASLTKVRRGHNDEYDGNNDGNDYSYDYDDDEENKQAMNRFLQIVCDLIVIVVIFAIFLLVLFLVDPKNRYFTCDQSDVFYPYIADTVPFWAVGIYGTLGPLMFIVLIELINSRVCSRDKRNLTAEQRRRQYFISLYHGISLFILGIAISLLLTEIGKRWIGRLRPYFMSVCKPITSTIDCQTSGGSGFVYNYVDTSGSFCTGDANSIKEARLSFPSGHASFSFYTMLYLIIYLEARLLLLRFRYIKSLLQMTAFIAAYVTSLSRVSDYHHRGSDVIGGAVLGSLVALFITLVLGRVLWTYGRVDKHQIYHDFDLRPILSSIDRPSSHRAKF